VSQLVNDYENDVFNGDLGVIRKVERATGNLLVEFPPATLKDKERSVQYSGRQLEDLELGWAITVHKAQGGESKAVVLVLSHRNGQLLNRRLLYTGELDPPFSLLVVAVAH
jgi:exodeoxyribonuclease V alpha subunit